MGLFSKYFGTKQPAPPCTIHPDDKNLVRAEDVEWWNGLSFDDSQALEQEDNAFRFAAFKKLIEADGFSDAEAGKKVRLSFPTFYGKLEHRAEEKFTIEATDAKLPYALKDRINRALMNRVIDKQTVSQASSFNALVRQLIRSGHL